MTTVPTDPTTRYAVGAENRPGCGATIAARASTISFDGSSSTGELLPGPLLTCWSPRLPRASSRIRALLGPAAVSLRARAATSRSSAPTHTAVAILAALGGLLAFAVGVLFTYTLFAGGGPPTDAANGGWITSSDQSPAHDVRGGDAC